MLCKIYTGIYNQLNIWMDLLLFLLLFVHVEDDI